MYDTQSFSESPVWPKTQLALSLGQATQFEHVNRAVMLQAGADLGLAKGTATRELDKMLKILPEHADRLITAIEASYPAQAINYQAGELRLLRAIRHVIVQETLQHLQ